MRIMDWLRGWSRKYRDNGQKVEAEPKDGTASTETGRRRAKTTTFVCPQQRAKMEDEIAQAKQQAQRAHDQSMETLSDLQAQSLKITTESSLGQAPPTDD